MRVELSEFDAIDYIKKLQNCHHYNYSELKALYELSMELQEDLKVENIEDILRFGIMAISKEKSSILNDLEYNTWEELEDNNLVLHANDYYIVIN